MMDEQKLDEFMGKMVGEMGAAFDGRAGPERRQARPVLERACNIQYSTNKKGRS